MNTQSFPTVGSSARTDNVRISGRKKHRLFLADPMCATEFGHNAQSIDYFTKYFEDRGFEVIPLICKSFPHNNGVYAEYTRSFHYYYQDFIAINEKSSIVDGKKLPDEYAVSLDRIRTTESSFKPYDKLDAVSTADWLTIFAEHDIGNDDYIFFPSVDYYGWCGILRAILIDTGRDTSKLKVHGRFIGVMENATKSTSNPLRVIRALQNAAKRKCDLSVSAEAPVYAELLEENFGIKVTNSLYPMKVDLMSFPDKKPFIVYSAGAGRQDKGFLELLSIATQYAKLYPSDDVVFRVQNLRPDDEVRFNHYTSQLYAAPNIELIDAVLTDEEMKANYENCHFLLMPYSFEIYRLRGSAVLMEGIARGRPFAISAYTGFHPVVSAITPESNCTTVDQFCDAIHNAYTTDIDVLSSNALKAASEYERISFAGMNKIFGEVSA